MSGRGVGFGVRMDVNEELKVLLEMQKIRGGGGGGWGQVRLGMGGSRVDVNEGEGGGW